MNQSARSARRKSTDRGDPEGPWRCSNGDASVIATSGSERRFNDGTADAVKEVIRAAQTSLFAPVARRVAHSAIQATGLGWTRRWCRTTGH